jgi:predicted ArsR family transcriptional regulator
MPEARQRAAFLKRIEGWSSAEIAELLGISQSTVRAHLKLARDEQAEESARKSRLPALVRIWGEGVSWWPKRTTRLVGPKRR